MNDFTAEPAVEDALAESLRGLGVGLAMSAYTELATPWAARMPAAGARAAFHMVFTGTCWLRVPGMAAVRLDPGDVALVPHGSGHELADGPDTVAVPLAELLARPRGRRVDHQLLCGVYKFGNRGLNPVLALLPPVIHLPAAVIREVPGFAAVLGALRDEAASRRPGGRAVVASLVDAVFIYIVRTWIGREDSFAASWLSALRDPGLARTLAHIHADPGRPWTVASLATLATMSRAAFARRFTSLVGTSPLAYVAARRLDRAARLLRETDQPLAAIAGSVGYDSEFAMSRAFKRSRGVAPGRYRAAATT